MTYRRFAQFILLPAFLAFIMIACGDDSITTIICTPPENQLPVDGVVPGDYTVGSQADVDALAGVTKVDGSLNLHDISKLNLNALNSIEEITGDLTFTDDPLCPSTSATESLDGETRITTTATIAGMNSLVTVLGTFNISDTDITSITGFNALEKIGKDYLIDGNNALARIDGFIALEEVETYFAISSNDALVSISGFNALEVAGDFLISENSALASISGFNALKEVAGDFGIGDNPVLASIPEFNALKEVAGDFKIGGFEIGANFALASISGFNALKEVAGFFEIVGNLMLASISGFDALENVEQVAIVGNSLLASISGFNALKEVAQDFLIKDNPVLASIDGFYALEEVEGFDISNNDVNLKIECPSFQKLPPSFRPTCVDLGASLTVTPETSTVTAGDPAVEFTATLTDSTDTINWTLTGEGRIPANSTGTTVSYTPPTTGDASTATLTASAGSLSDFSTITINAAEPPSITSVSIRGVTGSTQVRQGAGAITLEVTGTKLLGITDADLAGLAGTLEAGATDSAAAISFTIPAGASLGARTLTLTLPSTTISQESAVTVTRITSSPAGSDTDRGTTDSPFRTLKMAVSVATANSGDLIFLQDGTYNQASGESFPQSVNGLSIEGESQAGVVIDGTGSADNSNGLDLSGVSSLSKLTIQNFDGPLDPSEFINFVGNGVMVASGTVTLSEVTSTLSNNGFQIEGGSATVSDSSFTNNSYFGVSAKTDSMTVGSLTMRDSTVTGNGTVVQGVIVAGINIDTLGDLDLDSVTVSGNGQTGVSIGNTGAGASTIKLRNSSITNHTGGNGFRVSGASTVIDLGKPASAGAAEAGNNVIKDVGDNIAHFSINDGRSSTDGAGVELWAFGNDLGGTGSAETGIKVGPDSSQKRYNIFGAGNIINFGP